MEAVRHDDEFERIYLKETVSDEEQPGDDFIEPRLTSLEDFRAAAVEVFEHYYGDEEERAQVKAASESGHRRVVEMWVPHSAGFFNKVDQPNWQHAIASVIEAKLAGLKTRQFSGVWRLSNARLGHKNRTESTIDFAAGEKGMAASRLTKEFKDRDKHRKVERVGYFVVAMQFVDVKNGAPVQYDNAGQPLDLGQNASLSSDVIAMLSAFRAGDSELKAKLGAAEEAAEDLKATNAGLAAENKQMSTMLAEMAETMRQMKAFMAGSGAPAAELPDNPIAEPGEKTSSSPAVEAAPAAKPKPKRRSRRKAAAPEPAPEPVAEPVVAVDDVDAMLDELTKES